LVNNSKLDIRGSLLCPGAFLVGARQKTHRGPVRRHRLDPLEERIAVMKRFPEVSVPEFTRILPGQRRSSGAPEAGQTLLTADGVRLNAVHRAGVDRRWAFVLCHGFSGSWRTGDMGQIVDVLRPYGGVIAFDFRGHGQSHGRSTLGDLEVLDLHAAVEWARVLGYENVATVGFSMGASVVVRHGGLCGSGIGHGSATDAVVSVSGPGWWFERSTRPMKLVHWLVRHPVGRVVSGMALKTRILPGGWDPVPESPVQLVGRIAPVPLLVVHGDADKYFPLGHAEALYAAAGEPRELWVERGFGHAEAAAAREEAGRKVVDRIGRWVRALPAGGAATGVGSAGGAESVGEAGEAEEAGGVGEILEDEAG
jgi:pimeloyl-ACP methyl ester carboxylesterase